MTKRLLPIILFIIALGLGAWFMSVYQQSQTPIIETQSTVLLEKVRKVCKLVTIEADFGERYTEKNIRPITVYLPFPTTFTFPKEASILVSGKVLVGYNMEKVNIKMDDATKTVVISNLPEPEILAIDHEVEFENMKESYFNSFTKDDYTQLSKNAKQELKKKAIMSQLMDDAKAEGNQLFEIIDILVKNSGWTLEVVQPEPIPN